MCAPLSLTAQLRAMEMIDGSTRAHILSQLNISNYLELDRID